MEVLKEDRISIRSYVLKNLDYYISESVYYRAFSEEIGNYSKQILLSGSDESGKLKLI